MHHITQWGMATFQITLFLCHPNRPCQQTSKSTTFLGITQWSLNNPKIISLYSLAKGQCNSKLSTFSLTYLHIEHQLTTIIFLFYKFSTVKFLPKEAVQIKKVRLEGILDFQILFQGTIESTKYISIFQVQTLDTP